MTDLPAFALGPTEVHVWTSPLAALSTDLDRLESLLTADERARAARFVFERDKRAFISARGLLRTLLGRYLNTPAAEVRFDYGARGKPGIVGETSLRFNLAHSGLMVLIALTELCEIGADIEAIRPMDNGNDIAKRFFSAEECAELATLPVEEQQSAFFRCWTRKEAYIKALGEGLSVALDDFCVTLRPGEPARLVHISNDRMAALQWTMREIEVGAGYVAAIAYRDKERPLRKFTIASPEDLQQLMPVSA